MCCSGGGAEEIVPSVLGSPGCVAAEELRVAVGHCVLQLTRHVLQLTSRVLQQGRRREGHLLFRGAIDVLQRRSHVLQQGRCRGKCAFYFGEPLMCCSGRVT